MILVKIYYFYFYFTGVQNHVLQFHRASGTYILSRWGPNEGDIGVIYLEYFSAENFSICKGLVFLYMGGDINVVAVKIIELYVK